MHGPGLPLGYLPTAVLGPTLTGAVWLLLLKEGDSHHRAGPGVRGRAKTKKCEWARAVGEEVGSRQPESHPKEVGR